MKRNGNWIRPKKHSCKRGAGDTSVWCRPPLATSSFLLHTLICTMIVSLYCFEGVPLDRFSSPLSSPCADSPPSLRLTLPALHCNCIADNNNLLRVCVGVSVLLPLLRVSVELVCVCAFSPSFPASCSPVFLIYFAGFADISSAHRNRPRRAPQQSVRWPPNPVSPNLVCARVLFTIHDFI